MIYNKKFKENMAALIICRVGTTLKPADVKHKESHYRPGQAQRVPKPPDVKHKQSQYRPGQARSVPGG